MNEQNQKDSHYYYGFNVKKRKYDKILEIYKEGGVKQLLKEIFTYFKNRMKYISTYPILWLNLRLYNKFFISGGIVFRYLSDFSSSIQG